MKALVYVAGGLPAAALFVSGGAQVWSWTGQSVGVSNLEAFLMAAHFLHLGYVNALQAYSHPSACGCSSPQCCSAPINLLMLCCPGRLPAVRVTSILTVSDKRIGCPPCTSAAVTVPRSSVWWSTTGAVAKRLAAFVTSVVEAHRTWGLQSYQSLQRVGSKLLLRSSSLGTAESAEKTAADAEAGLAATAEEAQGTLGQFKASLSKFLTTASKSEVCQAAMLSDLSNMAYDVTQITDDLLQERHNLHLIACSQAVGGSCDFAASTLGDAITQEVLTSSSGSVSPLTDSSWALDPYGTVSTPISPRSRFVVSAMTLMDEQAPAMAVNADSLIQQSQQRQTHSSPVPEAVTAAENEASTSQSTTEDEVEAETEPTSPSYPADWFACDDLESGMPTRYFVIQGSITLDHWRINLTIDPCVFEDGSTGVKVHRGVYESALLMYDAFVPLVQEHLALFPDGKICFTGHSLGGSLATVLMMLLVYR